ncbi:MAG TPA: ABC transporter permease [Candidatus Anaerobutyricum avicola]|nr:ABC transporter permease [Candidatus Anaerobutyricum avicola]
MLENIRLSFQGIWGHKLRSLLTTLGIIIGIAAIIAIVSTIQGTNEQIRKNLIGSGTNTVNVRLVESGDWDYDMAYGSIPSGIPVLDSEMREDLNDIDHVEDASLYTVRTAVDYIYYNDTSLQGGELIGADSHYLNTCGYVMTKGRAFTEGDYTNYRKVAVIDTTAADSLFDDENPVGKTIDIQGEPFTIIGVIEESSQFEPVIESVEDYYQYMYDDAGSSGSVIIPDTVWNIVGQYDEPQNVRLLADSTDAMSEVGRTAANLLNDFVDNETIKYSAEDIMEQAQQNEQLSESTNQQLIWTASISLLVGGIGVMNIMLVSVTERTREIGLKKAIGARKNKILAQFLTEAAVLTSLGGILGTITGIIFAEAISRISNVPVAISIPAVIIAIVFSMLIGIIFGFFPAVKAANLDPIVALRHE